MDKFKYEIRRIGVFSVVKTLFLLGGFSGFALGFVHWVLLRMIWWVGINTPVEPGLFSQPEAEELLGDLVGAVGILFPLFGALAGAAFGVVAGFLLTGLYNLGARIWGGLELELKAASPSAQPVLFVPARPGEPTPLPGGTDSEAAAEPETKPERDDDGPPPRPSSAMYE
jgi:hypothetical protein